MEWSIVQQFLKIMHDWSMPHDVSVSFNLHVDNYLKNLLRWLGLNITWDEIHQIMNNQLFLKNLQPTLPPTLARRVRLSVWILCWSCSATKMSASVPVEGRSISGTMSVEDMALDLACKLPGQTCSVTDWAGFWHTAVYAGDSLQHNNAFIDVLSILSQSWQPS